MIYRTEYPEEINWLKKTKMIELGEKIEVSISDYRPRNPPIIRIDSETYKVRSTGEIKQIKHGSSRMDAKQTLRHSFKRLRNIIDCNVTSQNRQCVHWVTLTFAENMTDHKRLYEDFRKFNMRLKYWCRKEFPDNSYEYIAVAEPQARGAWHLHLILIWKEKAPFIKNENLAEIWGYGFVKINALKKNVSNVARYLCAYLTDLPIEDAQQCEKETFSNRKYDIKNVNDRAIIKGARLELYPAGFQIFRCSKGIKHPKETKLPYYEAQHILKKENANLISRKAYIFETESGFINAVYKTIYDRSPAARRKEIRRRYYENLKMLSILNEEAEYEAETAHEQELAKVKEIDYQASCERDQLREEPLPVTDWELRISNERLHQMPQYWL